jgi:DNA polymerase-3 subunit beta
MNGSQILFRTNTLFIASRLLEGKYVNFRQMLPNSYTLRAVLSTHLISLIIKTAALFAEGSDRTVQLTFRPGKSEVLVEAEAEHLGTNSSAVEARFEGETTDELSILFNVRYLAEILSALGGTAEVAFELRSRSHPLIIRKVASKNVVYLLMPLQIKDRAQPRAVTTA